MMGRVTRAPAAVMARAGLRRAFSSPPPASAVRQKIDVDKVLPLLVSSGGLTPAEAKQPIELLQFSHGQSNPTYLLSIGGERKLVLRKQPPGKLLRGAHAIDREYRCMTALGASTKVPVPGMRLFVEDAEVLGTPFFVCDYVAGRFFDDPTMKAAASPTDRRAMYDSFLTAIAAIHTADYKGAGLGDFGKEGGYIARQTKVWTSQYRAAETDTLAPMERLLAWLPEALPADDDVTTLVHGDLRVDNCIFASDGPEVLAVLDWELATLGHPGTDLALVTMPYDTPEAWPKALSGFGSDVGAKGIPTEDELVGAYVEATGLASVPRHLDYYRAFACFRMASILQGVYKRSLGGNASSADGAKIGKLAGAIAGLGVKISERYEKTPDRLVSAVGVGATSTPGGGFGSGKRQYSTRASSRGLSTAMAEPPPPTAEAMPPAEYAALRERLLTFMHEDIYPNEQEFARQNHSFSGSNEWMHPPILIDLMRRAKEKRLWNLFLPNDTAALVGGKYGAGLTNLQYADLCEIMGTSIHGEMAAQATNCTSPDTGNMETIARFGTEAQKEKWLVPLLEGKMRSCFAMTEPDVASSDATNVSIDIQRDGGDYVINGRKWWCTGAGSLHTKIMILMGKTDPDHESIHRQQSMLLVPMDTPGIRLVRPLSVFGDDDAPKGHMEIAFEDCRVPQSSILWGEGKGFEIAQRRLGPGRIHHCMRAIGQAERALSLMCARADSRVAFGKPLAKRDTVLDAIAKARAEIDMMRHLVRQAAELMDTRGNTDLQTRQLLSIVKAKVPQTVQQIADEAMQVHGAAGMCGDTPLATIFASARCLRLADGPDEVHWRKAGQLELKNQRESRLRSIGLYTPKRDESEPHFRYTTDSISAESSAAIASFEELMSE